MNNDINERIANMTLWISNSMVFFVLWLISVRQVAYQLPGTTSSLNWIYGFFAGALMVPALMFPARIVFSFLFDHSEKFRDFVTRHWGKGEE